MKKIFVLSKETNFVLRINGIIDKSKYEVVCPSVSVYEIYNYSRVHKADIFIIHTSYLEGYYQVVDMLLFSKKSLVIYFSTKMECGALYNALSSSYFNMISDMHVQGVNEYIEIMYKDIMKIELLENQVRDYKEKILEEELVRKAKLALMKKRGLSENDAYKALLKKSMDLRISKGEAASKILEEVAK